MRLEKRWKPSGMISNSRYRGVTELMQYSNFILETVHDLNLLSHIITGNEKTNTIGHERAIENNHLSLFNGGVDPAYYNTFTSSSICKIDRNRPIEVPALDKWEAINGATCVATGNGFTLEEPGLKSPGYIRTPIFVMPGDVIFMRFKVKSSMQINDFGFGSENINGLGVVKKIAFAPTTDGFFVDYRLYCKSQQTIYINLYTNYEPTVLKKQSITIEDFKLFYGQEIPVGVVPLNGNLKRDLNETREVINFLKK